MIIEAIPAFNGTESGKSCANFCFTNFRNDTKLESAAMGVTTSHVIVSQ